MHIHCAAEEITVKVIKVFDLSTQFYHYRNLVSGSYLFS